MSNPSIEAKGLATPRAPKNDSHQNPAALGNTLFKTRDVTAAQERKEVVVTTGMVSSEAALPTLHRSFQGPFTFLASMSISLHRTLKRLCHILVHRRWLWEFASLAVSTLAMMVIIIILVKVDGTALSDWAFPIQPNSMVSVFMTISKSALLVPVAECISQSKWLRFRQAPRPLATLDDFDEASRGPWGSFMLLFSPRAAGMIAWSGAILTIASLALDPFTQQILAYPSRHVPSPTEVAEIAVSQSLERINQPEIRGAVLSSLYVPKDHYMTYNCTTSSCSWGKPVTSLGLCASCRTITSLVIPTCITAPGPLFPAPDEEQTWNMSITTCTYAVMPEITLTIYIQTLFLPASNGRHAEHAAWYTQVKMTGVKSKLGRLIDPSIQWIFTALSFVSVFDKDQRNLPPLDINILNPELSACGVYFCAQVYPFLAVTNGTLVNTSPSVSYPLYPAFGAGRTPSDDEWEEVQVLNSSSLLPGKETRFMVSQQSVFSLQGIFMEVFNVTKTNGNDKFSVFPDPDFGMDGISTYAYRNISSAWAGIVKSVSGQIRVAEGSQKIAGHAMVDETFISVSWGWVSLPLGLLGCVGVLLGATTRRHRAERIWKGSSVALMVHPLTGCEHACQEHRLDGLESMDRFASGVNVRLESCSGSGDDAAGMEYKFVRVPSQ